jgi:hypothetical protein
MARKTNRIGKAAVALVAAALVEKGVEAAAKALKNRRARRKVTALTKNAGKRAKGAAKSVAAKAAKLGSAARERVPPARKKAAGKLVKLAKVIAP